VALADTKHHLIPSASLHHVYYSYGVKISRIWSWYRRYSATRRNDLDVIERKQSRGGRSFLAAIVDFSDDTGNTSTASSSHLNRRSSTALWRRLWRAHKYPGPPMVLDEVLRSFEKFVRKKKVEHYDCAYDRPAGGSTSPDHVPDQWFRGQRRGNFDGHHHQA